MDDNQSYKDSYPSTSQALSYAPDKGVISVDSYPSTSQAQSHAPDEGVISVDSYPSTSQAQSHAPDEGVISVDSYPSTSQAQSHAPDEGVISVDSYPSTSQAQSHAPDEGVISVDSYPSTSQAQSHAPDDGVISVDVSRDVLVDSMTDMSETPIPPDIIATVDTTAESEEETNKLTLAYENLYEIPKTIVERFADHIKYLDISHNKITNLDALVYFKSLTSLIADDNPITENCYLPPLPKLELLWLNRCKVASLYPWVGKLKESCPNLQYLSLMGNPAAPSYFNGGTFYEYLQYRLFVISQFPSLTHLDDRRVTEDQRLEAQRLYKRPLFERIVNPGASISQLVNTSVTWNSVQTKLSALLGKDKPNDRNLLI